MGGSHIGASQLFILARVDWRSYCSKDILWITPAEWNRGAEASFPHALTYPRNRDSMSAYGSSSRNPYSHLRSFVMNLTFLSLSCLVSFCLSSLSIGLQMIGLSGYVNHMSSLRYVFRGLCPLDGPETLSWTPPVIPRQNVGSIHHSLDNWPGHVPGGSGKHSCPWGRWDGFVRKRGKNLVLERL